MPLWAANISASTAIAISSGLSAPTGRPIGQLTPSSISWPIPASNATLVKAFHFDFEPITPNLPS